ncbi:hypothetical protein Tco_0681930 [Tanacetum coccineum]|uniref:Uncharacterized protein n=1 Tax=Tanacetum coccineum TaxID=301880 RepID=A0ABQ4XR95_9ASTR
MLVEEKAWKRQNFQVRMHVYNKQQFLIEDEAAAAGRHLWFMMIIGFLVSSGNLVTTTKRKDLVIPVLCQTKVSAARVKRSFVLMLLASKVFNAAYSSAATWDDHTINGGTLVLLVYLVNAAKVNSWNVSTYNSTNLVLGWDKDSIKLKKAVFGFIEDVITKTIDYHLFDVVVEFHREIHDLNFRGSSCKNLFVLSSSNRGRLLGFTDLMRQKNKRMKQEELI